MKIVSMVASVTMERPFDLDELLIKLPESEPCLNWVRMRFSSNKNHVALYKSGKVLISGTKSDSELNSIANDLIKYLDENGIFNSITNIKVNNYVIVDQFDFKIELEKLILELLEYDVSYEPEQFPALKFKDRHGITYLLFSSGKITITGVKSLNNIEMYIQEFKDLINKKLK